MIPKKISVLKVKEQDFEVRLNQTIDDLYAKAQALEHKVNLREANNNEGVEKSVEIFEISGKIYLGVKYKNQWRYVQVE